MNWLDYAIMVAFILAICAMGGLFTTRRKGGAAASGESEIDEHLMAGGRTPWWAAAISYVMALFSTVSLVSTPGEAYNNGLRLYVLEWFAPFTGLLFFFIFVRFYFNVKTFTPFAYLERRFDARVRCLVSSIYLFTRISILAMILFACARIFQGLAGWPVWVTALLVGTVSIIYSTLGGLKAVIWTHVLQFVVMIIGIGAAVVLATRSVNGGAAGVLTYSFAHGKGFRFEQGFFSFNPHVRVTFWALMMSSIFAYMFYGSSDQIAIQQLLCTNSYKAARRSFITSTLIFVPLGALLWFLGLAVFVYYAQNPLPGGNPPGDLALFRFIVQKTPQPIPGLVAAAALSAATSTIGAMIMSLSTVATKDFYVRFFREQATDQQQVACARWSTFGLGVLGTVMAIVISFTADSLRETVIEANTIWGAIITVVPPVFFLGVISRRCNANHVLAAVAFGTVITGMMIAWYLRSRWQHNPISYLDVAIPAFVGTIVFGLLAPYVAGKRPSREKLANLTLFTLSPTAAGSDSEDNSSAIEATVQMSSQFN
jgi:SSS family transporter